MEKIRLGTNEDGSPHYLYRGEDLVYTGPNITGTATVTHPDGTEFVYDVNDLFTEVFPGHQLYLAEAVGKRFEEEGHPAHDADTPFVPTPVAVSHDLSTGESKPEFSDVVHEQGNPQGPVPGSPEAVIAAVSALSAPVRTLSPAPDSEV